ncbi:MAG: acetoin utilization protein AcuC [Anaerolineae bacterium]
MGEVALIFHEIYRGRGFSPVKASWPRYGAGYDLMASLGLIGERVRVIRPEPATDAELLLAHTIEYVARVRAADEAGVGNLDGQDTPAWQGMYRRATTAVGGTLLAARLTMAGDITHAFNPAGGLHHAQLDRASGFCVFNDIVVAVRALQREFGLTRIAVVDVDGHHGDGTQALLYDEPLLTISLHQYDGRFYPGTGRVEEIGRGAGRGYSVNVPLPRRVGDATYLAAFDAVVPPLLRAYRPEFILVQFGTDAHMGDPLVGLSLTTRAYAGLARRLHALGHELSRGRLLFLGGGGYNPPSVARCWAILMAILTGDLTDDTRPPYAALLDEQSPTEEPSVGQSVASTVDQVQTQVFPLFGLPRAAHSF